MCGLYKNAYVLIFQKNKKIRQKNLFMYSQRRIQDFSEGVSNSRGRCANQLFCKIFAENCMKMEEFGPREMRPWRALNPPLTPSWFTHACPVTAQCRI